MLQPEPEIEAVALPATLVWLRVPVMEPLIEQLLHVKPENGMEKAPSPPTIVVPEDNTAQLRRPEFRGTLAVIA